MKNKKGYIYIFTNDSLKDTVKLGYASDVEQRRKTLSNTSVPMAYQTYAVYEVPTGLEDKKLHKLIDKLNPNLRISQNREFYLMKPEEAYDLLECIAQISGTLGKLKRVAMKETAQEKAIKEKKRGAFKFSMCGIKRGAIISYIKKPSITAKVVDDNHVEYKVGNQKYIMSLTALAITLLGKKGYHIPGPNYFSYKGKRLDLLRKEKEKKRQGKK